MKPLLTFLITAMATWPLCAQPISIIPKPSRIEFGQGTFTLNRKTAIHAAPVKALVPVTRYLRDGLAAATGLSLKSRSGTLAASAVNVISFRLLPKDTSLGAEGYRLIVLPKRISVESMTPAGAFYAVQSLLQLLPVSGGRAREYALPSVMIADAPRFGWRGMHLDVSRHFFPKEFVKQYIDLLAMHKMNVFHWHLTDDQGWRIEIKKYPKLTRVGAWRVDRENIPEWTLREPQQPGETPTYGGFYTQDDIREIVKYAADRFVTVVPEIEMPAHVRAALAAYPQFSCTGGPFTVLPGSYWPITDILCAGNDSTFTFLQDVLTEVMDLFPGTYIHIGGDEADKTEWRKCPKCQARIKAEGLKDEAELQSYFVKRIEKFITSKGRRIIGWDEILEGGLAPEATVMSWRGINGGIAAAKQGHHAVMSPTSTCYFDYYQGPPEIEPLSIGGYVPVSAVYAYEPVPDSLSADEAKYILGAQANLWTEYIPTPSHAEYMVLPRMDAMSEVCWTQKSNRDWSDFAGRLAVMIKRYQRMGLNCARSAYAVRFDTAMDTLKHSATLMLSTEVPGTPIRYTTDGSLPTPASTLYQEPLTINRSMTIRAGAFDGHGLLDSVTSRSLVFHKAAFKPVKLLNRYARYAAGGPGALTDAMQGSKWYADGRWQGYQGNDLVATVDLQDTIAVSKIVTRYLQDPRSWIFFPDSVQYQISLNDSAYTDVARFVNPAPTAPQPAEIKEFAKDFPAAKARYVRVIARNLGTCPDWHAGKGQPAWLFVDEIVVE